MKNTEKINVLVESFNCLKNITNISDQVIYVTLMNLLNTVALKIDETEFVLCKQIETIGNKQYIIDNWETLFALFKLPERLRKNHRLVSETIKFIINQINGKYNYKKIIKIKNTEKSICNKDFDGKCMKKKISFTLIKL